MVAQVVEPSRQNSYRDLDVVAFSHSVIDLSDKKS